MDRKATARQTLAIMEQGAYQYEGRTIDLHSELEEAVRSSFLITPQQAKEIALSNAPGASVRKCELDYDDGIAVYEIELRNGPIEYEFEINASNGNILDLDIDHDD